VAAATVPAAKRGEVQRAPRWQRIACVVLSIVSGAMVITGFVIAPLATFGVVMACVAALMLLAAQAPSDEVARDAGIAIGPNSTPPTNEHIDRVDSIAWGACERVARTLPPDVVAP